MFYLVRKKFQEDAIDQDMAKKSFCEFSQRVRKTIKEFPVDIIDQITDSMSIQINKIAKIVGKQQNIDFWSLKCQINILSGRRGSKPKLFLILFFYVLSLKLSPSYGNINLLYSQSLWKMSKNETEGDKYGLG